MKIGFERRLGCVVLALACCAAGAQDAKPKCATSKKGDACRAKEAAAAPVAPSVPSAIEAFPFPTDDSKGKAEPAASNPAKLPGMPTDRVPDPPAESDAPRGVPAGGSSSSRAPEDDVAPTTEAPDAPIKGSALKDLGSSASSSEARARLEQTRVADDLKIGQFYMKDGNAQGAYLRFKDAVERAPDDPEAHYRLAEAAAKLNKRDEAALHFKETLRLDPDGDFDKESRKGLGRLGVKL